MPQAANDVDLQPVDVLILVDEHVVKAVGDARPEHRIACERAPVDQQVVEIEHAERPLPGSVCTEALGESLAVLLTPGKALREDLRQWSLSVDGIGVDVEHRLGAGEAARARRVTQLLAHEVD